MTKKWVLVDPLPKLESFQEWDTQFDLLQNITYLLPRIPTKSEWLFLLENEAKWLLILHWVIKKKWISKHKIPVKRAVANLYEPAGLLWFHFLELCIQCHSLHSDGNYRNAAEWFGFLIKERKLSILEYLFIQEIQKEAVDDNLAGEQGVRPLNKNTQQTYRVIATSKGEFIAENQYISKCLRQEINPFDPNHDTHHYRLIQACLELSDRSDTFRKKFWKDFLRSYSGFIESFRNPHISFTYIENGVYRIRKGRGKYQPVIEPPDFLNINVQFLLDRKYLYPGKLTQ